MTFAKITAGTGYLYLVRHTALGDAQPTGERDAAAYYAAQGNPPGRWAGRGAPLLGLAGREVTEEQMRALFGLGAHPDMDAIVSAYLDERWRPWMTGERLNPLIAEAIRHATLGRQFPQYKPLEPFGVRVAARLQALRDETGHEPTDVEVKGVKAAEARRPREAVAGYDLVFSPVKSAALLWAVDPRPHVQEAIQAAHVAAKDAALAVLEEHAAFTRTGTDGVAQIATNGLIAAEFEHWDSRARDPNLHTHVAISSKVMGTDGVWRALDGRPLHAGAVAISETYNTAFEAELTARLGVTFTPRPGTGRGKEPVREISGVPAVMIEHFSRRRATIEARYADLERAYRDEHGHDPAPGTARKLAQQANLETRDGKKPPAPLEDKRAAWRQELAARFGRDAVSRLMNVVPQVPAEPPAEVSAVVDCADLAERALAALSARHSVWTVWNVRAEVERQLRATVNALPPGQHGETADAVIGAVLAQSICVEPPALLDEPAGLRRPDGESVFTQHAAARYTSQRVLDAESRLMEAARTMTPAGLPVSTVAAALDGFEARTGRALDPGQRHLVNAFATDSRLLLAGTGPAGAGKTTAMRALAHALRQGGRNLFDRNGDFYRNVLADFVVETDKLSAGLVIRRLERLYDAIYVDELQDLAGSDLHFLDLLFASAIQVTLVGDPRQGTYMTNQSNTNRKYRRERIGNWLDERVTAEVCALEERTESWRCNQQICDWADDLYPDMPRTVSRNDAHTGHDDVVYLAREDVRPYMEKFQPRVLRWSRTMDTQSLPAINFGQSKGSTFDRVLIFPTAPITKYLVSKDLSKLKARAHLYVAVTRARHSVAFVVDRKHATYTL